MLEDAIKTHLLSKAAITDGTGVSDFDGVGTRIWYGDIPPKINALPDVTFEIVSGDHEATLTGDAADLQFPSYVFTARSITEPTPCIKLADLIRRALHELRNGATVTTTYSGSVDIESVEILGETDDTESLKDGSEKVVYERLIVARVGYRHSIDSVS